MDLRGVGHLPVGRRPAPEEGGYHMGQDNATDPGTEETRRAQGLLHHGPPNRGRSLCINIFISLFTSTLPVAADVLPEIGQMITQARCHIKSIATFGVLVS